MNLRHLLLLVIASLMAGMAMFYMDGGFVSAAHEGPERTTEAGLREPESDGRLPAWPGAPALLDRDRDEERDPSRVRFAADYDTGLASRAAVLAQEERSPMQAGTPAAARNARTLTLRGKVVELDCEDGKRGDSRPAERVPLTLIAHYSGDKRETEKVRTGARTTVSTDEEGRFQVEFDNPPGSTFIDRVLIRIDEDAQFRTFRRAFPTSGVTTDVGSIVRIPQSELRGQVVRPSGAPLQDARVVLTLGGPEEDQRVVHTNSRGHWRLRDARRLRDLEVFHPGFRLVHVGELSESRTNDCDPDPTGVTSMLAPTGRLEIVTRGDDASRLAPGALAVEPSPSVFMRTERTARRATPDVTQPNAQGLLTFENCWAGIPLRLYADPPESSRGGACFGASRRLGDQMILEGDRSQGVPIVIPPGGNLRVELDLGEPVIVRGTVYRANGDPARLARVEARLSLNRFGRPNWRATEGQTDPWIRTRTNQAGEYEFALPRLGYEGHMRIVAGYRSNKRLGSGWDQHAAVAFDTASDQNAHAIDLKLIDDSFIEAHIVNPFGEQATYFVRALPSGWKRTDETPDTGEIAQVRTSGDGSFRLEGLPKGTYDLLVVREPALLHAFDLFRDVESGRDEVLEFTTTKKKRARVSLVAGGEGKAVSRMLVMHGRTWLPRGQEMPEGEHRVEAPTVWPLNLSLGTRGRDIETRVIGALFQSMTTRTPERGLLLDPFDAGWHSFGIQAFDAAGQPYAPVWTGPVLLGQGMHTFLFDLVETTDVVGSVEGEDLPWPMYVALVRNGRKIALRLSKDEPANYVPLGADGRFHLWKAPVGEYEVWVGSAFDLDTDRPQRRQPVTIEKRMTESLKIHW